MILHGIYLVLNNETWRQRKQMKNYIYIQYPKLWMVTYCNLPKLLYMFIGYYLIETCTNYRKDGWGGYISVSKITWDDRNMIEWI